MHRGCTPRSRYHTVLAAPGSLGGTNDHNFRRHLSRSDHIDNRAPKPEGQDDVEVSDEVAEQSRYQALLIQRARTGYDMYERM